jgi:hypothetical protein
LSKDQGEANYLFCSKDFPCVADERSEMKKKEGRTALQMAGSIGVDASEMGANWASLGMLNFSSILEGLGQEIGMSDFEWQKILAQAGLWMIDGLDAKIDNLQKMEVEQSTSIKLRRMFGVPLSLLAMPVFVELENMELAAKINLKKESIEASQLWEQINNRLLYVIQLFLAEQINLVEEDRLAHEAALAESKKEAEGVSLLATIQGVEEKFKSKLDELNRNKDLLLMAFSKVSRDVVNSVERAFETTIFSASSQCLKAVSIQ